MKNDRLQIEDLAHSLPVLRMRGIEIKDFRNIRYGNLDLLTRGKNGQAGMTGLYGQNGSGKSSVITAVSILKDLLSGRRLSSDICRQINIDSNAAWLSFTFEFLDTNLKSYGKAVYSFKIGHRDDDGESKTVVYDEILKLSGCGLNYKFRLQDIFNTSGSNCLEPAAKVQKLLGTEYLHAAEVLVEKELARRESRSFLFSSWLLKKLDRCGESADEEAGFMKSVFFRLKRFAERELYVLTAEYSKSQYLKIPSLMTGLKGDSGFFSDAVGISLDQPTPLPVRTFEAQKAAIRNVNQILGAIVPGLSVSIKVLETRLNENAEEIKVVQLVSCDNEKEIPLQFESDGIKKIISVLPLLICVYNHPSVTAVIDGLDTGIFEFLLGEVLQVIETRGKGQLIYTAHNLRLLEVLDKSSIVFSTANPWNRFIRMKNVKNSNNLRSMYYRELIVGEQEEQLYHSSNQSMISFAFETSGE